MWLGLCEGLAAGGCFEVLVRFLVRRLVALLIG